MRNTGAARRGAALLKIWTAKEAVLKALGVGLRFPPEQLQLDGAVAWSESPPPGLDEIFVVMPNQPQNHRLALAAVKSVKSFVFVDD